MWGSIILYTIISIIIVYISHQLWLFVNHKYSTKKYLVGSQITKYKTILRELQEDETKSDEPDDTKKDLEEFMRTFTEEN